jgi:hypothetical protein
MKNKILRNFAVVLFTLIVVLLLSWQTLFGVQSVTPGSFEAAKTVIVEAGYSVK